MKTISDTLKTLAISKGFKREDVQDRIIIPVILINENIEFWPELTLYHIQEWLREVPRLHIHLGFSSRFPETNNDWHFIVTDIRDYSGFQGGYTDENNFSSYEEALEAGIIHALNILPNLDKEFPHAPTT